MSREVALAFLVSVFGAMFGAAVGCLTEVVLIHYTGHDSLPVFYCLVAGGAATALLGYCAPMVAAYARTAVGRG
jgi:hypothetical protein